MRRLILAGFVALAALAAMPSAQADVDGPCEATVAGQDLAAAGASDAAQAIHVNPDDEIPYTFSADAGVVSVVGSGEYLGYKVELQEKEFDGNTSESAGTFNLSDLGAFGAGVYQVSMKAELEDGSECTAHFLLDVQGGVFAGPAGIAATAALVVTGGVTVAVTVNTVAGIKTLLLTIKMV